MTGKQMKELSDRLKELNPLPKFIEYEVANSWWSWLFPSLAARYYTWLVRRKHKAYRAFRKARIAKEEATT